MSGFYAGDPISLNRLELARREMLSHEKKYIDLTSSNPTINGFLFPQEILRSAADSYWPARVYNPDPKGNLKSREAIVEYYSKRKPSLITSPDDIFLTASTSESYSILFSLLTDTGDNILVPEVMYPLFEYLADIHHIHMKFYKLDENKDWKIDEESIYSNVDERTKAVLIISPHNPIGSVVHEHLQVFDDIRLPIICDEVFSEFSYKLPSIPSFGTLHSEFPVFHLNGISKLFALPDMKLGWIVLNENAAETYRERLELLNDTFLSAGTLVQHMLPTLFSEGWSFVEEMKKQIYNNITYALEKLSKSKNIYVQPPDGGYYLFPKVSNWHDDESLAIFLLEHGVLIYPGYFYGSLAETHIMISCLTDSQNLKAGIDKILDVLS